MRYDEVEFSDRKRKSVRGIGVSKVDHDAILSWEDFEVAHEANIASAQRRYDEAE